MKDSLIQQCLDILKKEEVKNQLKVLLKPIINFILYEINPYIYIINKMELNKFVSQVPVDYYPLHSQGLY